VLKFFTLIHRYISIYLCVWKGGEEMSEKMINCDCSDMGMSGKSITIKLQCEEDGKLSACIVACDCGDGEAGESETETCCC